MKCMRIPLCIVFGIAILGVILGSFADFQVSTAIASKTNMVGIALSAIGPTIGFCGLALVGGGFFALGFRKEEYSRKTVRIVFFGLAALIYAVSVFFAGQEYFSVNGFNKPELKWLGYLIAAVPLGGAEFLGYRLFKDTTRARPWAILGIITVICFIALVPLVTVLKEIFHRPRFRAISDYQDIVFHPWYQRCANYQDLMAQYQIKSEEFKSFPSGHATEISILFPVIVFMPLLNDKLARVQSRCFVAAGMLTILVAFARILAGAHFLSDVSMAVALMLATTIAGNEIVLRVKFFKIRIDPVRE